MLCQQDAGHCSKASIYTSIVNLLSYGLKTNLIFVWNFCPPYLQAVIQD